MKKIILFLLYSIGLLFIYYSSYGSNHSLYQQQLVNNAISNNDHEFFLKFNEKYNNKDIFNNENIYIYESFTEERYYNFIIQNLPKDKLEVFDYENITKVTVSSDTGSIDVELYADVYLLSNIYVVNISVEELIDECGSDITNIKFTNQYGEVLFNFDVNVEVVNFSYAKFTDGYTTDELIELYTFDSISNILYDLLIYHLVFSGIVIITILGVIIKRKFITKKE